MSYIEEEQEEEGEEDRRCGEGWEELEGEEVLIESKHIVFMYEFFKSK